MILSAKTLLDKYANAGSRYAQYRTAEAEAWKLWYKSGAETQHRDPALSFIAVSLADEYHHGGRTV